MKQIWQRKLTTIQREFIVYSFIGVSGLTIDYLLFFLLSSVFGLHYLAANIASVFVAVTNNFVWNAFLNFKVKNKLWVRYVSFLGVGTVGLGISSALLWLQVEWLGISPLVGKGLTIGVVVVVQFALNKLITFRR